MGMLILIAIIALVQGIVFGGFSAFVAGEKNRSKANWFVLGFFFSFLALIALLAVPKVDSSITPKPNLKVLYAIAILFALSLFANMVVLWLPGDNSNAHEEDVYKPETSNNNGKYSVPVFVKIEPFVVKLRQNEGDSGEHYAQLIAEVKLKDRKDEQMFNALMPIIRNNILPILQQKMVSDLDNKDGMELLRKELGAIINEAMGVTDYSDAVFISSLIVQ